MGQAAGTRPFQSSLEKGLGDLGLVNTLEEIEKSAFALGVSLVVFVVDGADAPQDFTALFSQEKGGLIGSTMISDAFFPFRDGVDVGLKEGVQSILQPGGSLNDYQAIEACNENDATMVYTGQRSFKH